METLHPSRKLLLVDFLSPDPLRLSMSSWNLPAFMLMASPCYLDQSIHPRSGPAGPGGSWGEGGGRWLTGCICAELQYRTRCWMEARPLVLAGRGGWRRACARGCAEPGERVLLDGALTASPRASPGVRQAAPPPPLITRTYSANLSDLDDLYWSISSRAHISILAPLSCVFRSFSASQRSAPPSAAEHAPPPATTSQSSGPISQQDAAVSHER